jgi:hypothetical protein
VLSGQPTAFKWRITLEKKMLERKRNKKAVGWRAHGLETQRKVSVDGRTTPRVEGIATSLLAKDDAAEHHRVVHSFHSFFLRLLSHVLLYHTWYRPVNPCNLKIWNRRYYSG